MIYNRSLLSPSMDVLVKVADLSKTIEGKLLFEHVSFEVCSDNCIGLLGPNGCGKTTLFKILLGLVHASSGDVWRKDNLRMRYLDQVPLSALDETVYDFFMRTTQSYTIQQKIRDFERQLGDPEIYSSSRYVDVLESIRKLKVSASRSGGSLRWDAAVRMLKEIGLPDLDPSTKPGVLSGGEWQKVALASVLAQPKECDLLLLDEPTNHLDIETIEWLERRIVEFPRAVMMVSHDRYLLNDLVDRVFEMEGHRVELYDVTYDMYEEQKRLRVHSKIRAYEKSKAEVHRQKKVIETLSRRNKYDLQIASRMKRLAKVERVDNPVLKSYLLKFCFSSVFKSGKNVAEGHGLGKRFGSKIILDHAGFEILAGRRFVLLGRMGVVRRRC